MKTVPKRIIKTVHSLLPTLDSDTVAGSLNGLLRQSGVNGMAQRLPKYFDAKAEGDRAVAIYLAQLVRQANELPPLLERVPSLAGVPTVRQKARIKQRVKADCITSIPVGSRTLYLIPSRDGKEIFERIGQSPCTQENILDVVKVGRTRVSQILQMMERMGWIWVRIDRGIKTYSALVKPSSLHLINRNGHGFDNLIKEVIEALEEQESCAINELTCATKSKRKVVERILDQLIGASLIRKSGNHYSLLHQDTPIYAKAS